jgi:phage-related protein
MHSSPTQRLAGAIAVAGKRHACCSVRTDAKDCPYRLNELDSVPTSPNHYQPPPAIPFYSPQPPLQEGEDRPGHGASMIALSECATHLSNTTDYGEPNMVHNNDTQSCLVVQFFRQPGSGVEPVRDWLRSLPESERKLIGGNIRKVQFAWPIGLPLVDHLDGEIWEVRSRLRDRIARVLFAIDSDVMILLHAFIKKTQKTPEHDLLLAKQRLSKIRSK